LAGAAVLGLLALTGLSAPLRAAEPRPMQEADAAAENQQQGQDVRAEQDQQPQTDQPADRAAADQPDTGEQKPKVQQAGAKQADGQMGEGQQPGGQQAQDQQAKDQQAEQQRLMRRMRALQRVLVRQRAGRAVLRPALANSEGEAFEDNVFFPPDRETMQLLTKAKELLKAQRYTEAVKFLGKILTESEDHFFQPEKDQPIYRSLKAEAQRLIGSMPEAGREAYELEYGAVARRALERAAAAGDLAGLADVSRQYFHTRAGYEATYLLALANLDRNQPLAAALCLKRLQESPAAARLEPGLSFMLAVCWQRAGVTANAAAVLLDLRRRLPEGKLTVAGKRLPLAALPEASSRDAAAQAVAWLERVAGTAALPSLDAAREEWVLFRGSPARNARTRGGMPLLNRRWAVRVINDPFAQEELSRLAQAEADQGTASVPALQPLAVGGWVLMRGLTGLEAVDFRTGKRVWAGGVDESVRQLLESAAPSGLWENNPPLSQWLADRVWRDMVYGQMSSDGRHVYCVEDLGVSFVTPAQAGMVLANGRLLTQPTGPKPYNRLAAYELATEGKLRWELGSQPTEGGLPLAGAFFLGPPLPLAGRVYVLAELKGEVRLAAIEAMTGNVEWTQQLASLTSSILEDPLRRNTGATPSYADGVLVCPTAVGAVVGVDLTTRSLLWGYQYPQEATADYRGAVALKLRASGMVLEDPAANQRWVDSTVTLAEGRVLLTPPESNELHCLDLVQGSLLWKRPRDDGMYVGCVHDGLVLIVGRTSLRAVRLATGEPAWTGEAVALPSGAAPSGRGFFNGELYFLPLSSGEVAAVRVRDGSIVARARSRTGSVPGNLICYQGAVLSQGAQELECFFQIEDLRRQVAADLAEHPDDPAALARQGELLLDEGRHAEAIDHLRRSYALNADPHTRGLLVDALTEALASDFKQHREAVEELGSLATEPQEQSRYLRVVGQGLQREGEYWPAFETYLKLLELATATELERIDAAHSVRRDRWVQARLAELRAAADEAARREIDAAVAERLAAAQAAGGTEELTRFVRHFGFHPAADEARVVLAARLAEEGRLLEAEIRLEQVELLADRPAARAATARLAMLLHSAGRDEEAARWYRRLAGPLAEIECLPGQTGQQILDGLAAPAGMRAILSGQDPYPRGAVEQQDGPGQQGSAFPLFPVEVRFGRSSFLANSTIYLEHNQHVLVARDSQGRERWRLGLRERSDMIFLGNQLTQLQGAGHLLLVSLGVELVAIDALGSPGDQRPRVIWRQPLADPNTLATARQFGFQQRMLNVAGRLPRMVITDNLGRPLGSAGAATPHYVCYQRARQVIAVDPLSGETLWQRSDLPAGCEIMGDRDLVFVTLPSGGETVVLDALDGREVGRRSLPPPESRSIVQGRELVTWTNEGRWVLRRTDAWTYQSRWEKQFHVNSRIWAVEDEAVGVLEQGRRFVLVDAATGQMLVDAEVEAGPNLIDVFVLRSPSHDLLLLNHAPQNQNNKTFQPVPYQAWGIPLLNGRIYGFERRPNETVRAASWVTPIKNQGLLLTQPAGLPVLVFATSVWEQVNGRQQPSGTVVCLDKRTGRFVYRHQTAGQLQSVECVGDPTSGSVTVRTLRASAVLKFTDQPWPVSPQEGVSEEEQTPGKDRLQQQRQPPQKEDADAQPQADLDEGMAEDGAEDGDTDDADDEDAADEDAADADVDDADAADDDHAFPEASDESEDAPAASEGEEGGDVP